METVERRWSLRLRLECGHFLDQSADDASSRLYGALVPCQHCGALRKVEDVLAVRDSDRAALAHRYG